MVDDGPDLYGLLHCPETHQRLIPITSTWRERINTRINRGELYTSDGSPVREAIEAGLITEDDRYLYPVRQGVPNLMLTDRIVLAEE